MIPGSLYLLQNGEQIGPFEVAALRDMLAAGTIQPSDFVWGEGMAEWQSVGDLVGTAPAIPTVPGRPLKAAKEEEIPRLESFGDYVKDAFSYPFRGDGLIILICGTIFFTLCDLFSSLPAAGSAGVFLTIMTWGYLMLMLQAVIHGTAMGENKLPTWPDFDGIGELGGKCLQWLVTMAFCFGPGIAVLMFGEKREDSSALLALGLLVLGGCYFPVAALGVAMFDSVVALNPMLCFRSILAVPLHYLATLGVFVGLLTVNLLTGQVGGQIPILGTVLREFDGLWSAIFLSRVLGGLYYVNRGTLGWFSRV